MSRTWIFTGSPENHAATRERGFTVIGLAVGQIRRVSDRDAGVLFERLSAAAGVPS